MKAEFSKEKKERWLSRMYFSISDAPDNDVNPFENIPDFLKARVSDMQWGKDKTKSRERFCKKFSIILDLYDIVLSREDIMKGFEKENRSNLELVAEWASKANFPVA